MATDNKEKISKLDEKIKQLQAQKNQILAREKEKERKARTRRLIQVGALLDSKLNVKTDKDLDLLSRIIDEVKKFDVNDLHDVVALVNLYDEDSVYRNKIDVCLNAIHHKQNETQTQAQENVQQHNSVIER